LNELSNLLQSTWYTSGGWNPPAYGV